MNQHLLVKRLTVTLLVFLFFAFSVLIIWAAWFHQNKEIYPGTIQESLNWLAYRRSSADNKECTNYYSFQDEELPNGLIRNRRRLYPTCLRDLKLSPDERFAGRIVEGRWPGKQAVELDETPLRLSTESVSTSRFAIAAWVRHSGLGTIKGPNFSNAATVFALGDGTWNGWRIDLLYPSNRLVLQLARGKSEKSIGLLSSIRIPPKTWTHISVSRDEERVRIFVNGLLSAEIGQSVTPTPMTPGNSLKVGFAGNGLASAILQIDELSVYKAAPDATFFLKESLQIPHHLSIDNTKLEQASRAFTTSDYDAALLGFIELLENQHTDRSTHPTIRFRIGEIYRQLKKNTQAISIFRSLAQSQNTPSHIRASALHEYLAMREGANVHSDLFTYSSPLNSFDDYSLLAGCSEEYTNAMLEFDFRTPLKATARLPLKD